VKPNFLCLPLLTILFVIYFVLFYFIVRLEKKICDGNGILYTCTVCPFFVDIFVVGHLPAFWLAVAVAGAVVVACALISEP
jgi:hypothetical protein